MTANQSATLRIDALMAAYGDGSDGTAPSERQWAALFDRDPDAPVTLVNFFKMRDAADYPEDEEEDGTGQEAFDRYAAVSVPSMKAAGGTFLMVGPAAGAFCGPEEDWDLVVVGAYPDIHALFRLFENPAYQTCYRHRTAACAKQKVIVCDA